MVGAGLGAWGFAELMMGTAMRKPLCLIPALLFACGESAPDDADAASASGIDSSAQSETATDGGETTGVSDGSADTGQGSGTGDSQGTGGTTGGSTTDDSAGSDGSTGGDGSTGAAGSGGDPIPCDIAESSLAPVAPNIMLVLDKSGSMVDNTWDHDGMPATNEITRWNSLYDVVDFVVTSFQLQINFGANLFPNASATNNYDASACVVSNTPEIPVAFGNAATLLAGIPAADATNLNGGTPAATGITVARDHLVSLPGDNPEAIIFVTDGAANCAQGAQTGQQLFETYDSNLATVVGDAWNDDGIPTYVVGIDIEDTTSPVVVDGNPDSTNAYDELNTVANAGGVPQAGMTSFYQTTNQTELQTALQAIIDDALSCTVPLSPAPAFPDLMVLLVDDMEVPRVMDCATQDGWVYSNPNGPYDSVELCGTWCDTLKSSGAATAEYYCNPG